MNHSLAALLLLLVVVGWFLLPFLPALDELLRRKDVDPLRVSSATANIRHFAGTFRAYVERNLPALRELSPTGHAFTTLSDGATVWYAAPDANGVDLFAERRHRTDAGFPVVISEADLRVPDDRAVLREVFTAGSLIGGPHASYRAVLAAGDAELGPGSTVLRWIDAGGTLRVGADSVLWNRASCATEVSLGGGVRFQRLAAPRIVVESQVDEQLDAVTPILVPRVAVEPPRGTTIAAGRWMIDGDFTVPENGDVCCDLALTGTLTLGAGASLQGAVRCAELTAADHCTFDGAIVATECLALGADCRVVGPVVAEGDAAFGPNCRIGNPGDETTISAVTVRLGPGTTVCGEIWARDQSVVTTTPRQNERPVTKESPAARA